MDPRQFRGGRSATPQFVKPLLSTLDSMRGRDRPRAEQMNRQAEELLWSSFGQEGGAAEAAHAHASVELMAEHVHYFDGFALLMPLLEGCSVAVRHGQGDHQVVVGPDAEGPLQQWAREAVQALVPEGGLPLQVAVVSNVPGFLGDAVRVAVQLAAARAVSALRSQGTPPEAELQRLISPTDPDGFHRRAVMLSSAVTAATTFVLVDTRASESISISVPGMEKPGLTLIGTGGTTPAPGRPEKRQMVEEILQQLHAGSFPGIRSPRDIHHKDLERALGEVSRRLKPFLNYAVTEDGRVQKLVAAIQRRDWQMFGALLFMTHASRKADIGLHNERCDHLVTQVENMSLEGMYGATRLGADVQAVLVAGQPFSVPPALETLRASFEEHFHDSFSTLLL